MKANELYEQRQHFFLQLSKVGQGGLTLALLLGVLAFGGGMLAGEYTRTWGSLLFNLMFFFSLALGGTAFGNMQDVIGATWGRPVKRLHESFAAFLPWAAAFFVIFLFSIKFNFLGAQKVYSWVADPHLLDPFPGKNIWLQYDYMLIRDLVALAVILTLSAWHKRKTTAPDLCMLAGNLAEAQRLGLKSKQALRYWSAPVMVLYALSFSLITFDCTMSLAPTWLSTLWAGWSFSIMMQTLMAFTLIMMFMLRDAPIGQYFQRQQFHDIGKLLFGFTVFYAYLTYAHILTYWYGNVPEETSYFIKRLEAPWLYFVIAMPFISFLFPLFTMIPKVSKWMGAITIPVCVVVLISQWLNYLLVVIPEVVEGKNWYLPWIEVGVFCGFLGLFLLSIFRFGKKIPMLAIADPLLQASLHEGGH